MSEADREAFESHPQFSYLEFDRERDAWGRGKYRHSHIHALWEGWQAALAWDRSRQQAVDVGIRDALRDMLYVFGTDDNGEPLPLDESVTLGCIVKGWKALRTQSASAEVPQAVDEEEMES